MKAVFDTIVLVAAFATEELCSKLLHRDNRKAFGLFLSPFILREFEETLKKSLSYLPGRSRKQGGFLRMSLC